MRAFIATLALTAVQANDKYERFMQKVSGSNSILTPITIEVDGETLNKFVVSDSCYADGATTYCPENGRGYIINGETFDIGTPDFFTPNILGAKIEFDVDVSSFGCGCFFTFYTVSMPGKGSTGEIRPDDGYAYCDANAGKWGGTFCPEMDIMEGNAYAFQTTPHSCNAPSGVGSYDWCDGNGSANNSVDNGLDYGYGRTIDTGREYHVTVELHESNGQFAGTTTTLSQDGKTQSMSNWNTGYTANMTNDLKNGQAFVYSNWEGDDSWLRKGTCSGSCQGDPLQSVKNLKITSGGSGPVPPKPKPSDYDPSLYKFGNACATGQDDDCAVESSFCSSADHCRWSWLKDDTPSGSSAKCRCDGITNPINPADYDYGDACQSKDDDDCGIMHCPSADHCRFSWAKTDPDKWNGKTAHCRCDETVSLF